MLQRMLPAYGIFNAAWTVELVRTYRSPRALEIRNRRVGWWKERYPGR